MPFPLAMLALGAGSAAGAGGAAAGGLGLGSLLGLGGSALSGLFGGSRDTGTPEAQKWIGIQNDDRANRYLDAFYGSNHRKSANPAYGSGSVTDYYFPQAGAADRFSNFNYTPGGASGQGAAGSGTGGGATGRNNPLWGGNTPYGNLPILQQLMLASQAGMQEGQGSLNDFERGSEQGYREAARYGTGQNQVIDEDYRKSLKDANAVSLARLNGMGLGGSTIATDAMGANATGANRERARAKADLAQRATGFKLDQRNKQTSGRAALQQQVYGRNDQLRMLPIQGQLNALSSQTMNTGLPNGSSGSAPQNSLLASLGGTASQMGGLLLAKQLYGL